MSRLWLARLACLCVLLGGGPVLAELVPFGVAFQDRGYRWIGQRDGVTVRDECIPLRKPVSLRRDVGA